MNTNEVCKRLSVTPKMLRIYEEHGLLRPERKENNYRNYSDNDLILIETVSALRSLGFSIEEIKNMLEFDRTRNEHLDRFYLQYKAVDSQIKKLLTVKERLKKNINHLIGDDCSDLSQIILSGYGTEGRISYEDLMLEWDFDAIALDFNNRYLNEDAPYGETIRKTREILNHTKGFSFIDLGCGTCNLWQDFSQDIKLVCVDSSLAMLLESRKKFPHVEFRLDDMVNMFTDEYDIYDVVVSTFAIHHIVFSDQYKVIDNMFRLCRPFGTIIIADRCFYDENERKKEQQRLIRNKDTEELRRFNSEYYVTADEMYRYLALKSTHVTMELTEKNMVIFTAIK